MKKLFAFISILLINITSNAQELTGFMGIPFGTKRDEIKKLFLTKSPNSTIYTDKPGTLTFRDLQFGGRKAYAVVFGLNSEDEFHTAVVLLENNNDYEVFDLYDNVVADINNKYHDRDVDNELWRYPYDKSDKFNHGVTAIKTGKCQLQSMWFFDVNNPLSQDDDNVIAVENTESCTVKISYQNGLMINEVETKNKQKNSQDY